MRHNQRTDLAAAYVPLLFFSAWNPRGSIGGEKGGSPFITATRAAESLSENQRSVDWRRPIWVNFRKQVAGRPFLAARPRAAFYHPMCWDPPPLPSLHPQTPSAPIDLRRPHRAMFPPITKLYN